MTEIVRKKLKCHICGTEYWGLVVRSWNERLSGPFPKEKYKLICPTCGAPYRTKISPSIGIAKDILMKIISNPEEAAAILFKYSLTENDVDEWKKVLLEIDYKKWKRHDLECREKTKNPSESEITEFQDNFKKIEQLSQLKEAEKIQEIIERVVSLAKEKIREEKEKYSVS